MDVLTIDAARPAPGPVREAAEAVLRGGVIAFLGDAGYVLSCSIMDPTAVEFVHRLKRRSAPMAAVALVSDAEAIHALVDEVPPAAEALMRRHWPGPLSILFPASSLVPPRVRGEGGRIALRVPATPLARALLDAVGGPLMASSANVTGQPAAADVGTILRTFGNQIDVVLDSGPAPAGLEPATLVDVTGPRPVVVRAGAIDLAAAASGPARGGREGPPGAS
jgi:L-threonylcarbamoyladenylate synthase